MLRELERDDIIIRNKHDGFPRKVEYSLSVFGRTLRPVVKTIFKWEEKNLKTINKLIKKKHLDSLYDYY